MVAPRMRDSAVEKKIRVWLHKLEKEKGCTCMVGRPASDAARTLPFRTAVRDCPVHGDGALAAHGKRREGGAGSQV